MTGSARGFSRRRLLGLTGVGAVAGVTAGAGASFAGRQALAADPEAPVGFHGRHQAGIATPVQGRLHFAAFDVRTDSREELIELLREWTGAAARMTTGRPVGDGAVGGEPLAPPDDTGEALGMPPSQLTITIGFGPSLFGTGGQDRFGLASKRPAALVDLPHFPGDNIDPRRSYGDMAVQACANDAQVAEHAIRNLTRIGFGAVDMRWAQIGFGRAATTSRDDKTPRNLFGFKDGTDNLKADDTAAFDRHVWASRGDGPAWMAGGSYLVARRIRMRLETWDRTSLKEQQDIFGRLKGTGAAYGADAEHDPVPLRQLPPHAHVRLAHPDTNGGVRILRRSYNYIDGTDDLGQLDEGLFFLAYNRDPRRQFIPLQNKLTSRGMMNEYIEYVGNGIWACPPGVREGGFWGEQLFT